MKLVEFLALVNNLGITLTIYNDPPEELWFVKFEKGEKVLKTCTNVSRLTDDSLIVDWLCMALCEFQQFCGEERKSEYATKINQDLGILGE